jgi:hypothetical protein
MRLKYFNHFYPPPQAKRVVERSDNQVDLSVRKIYYSYIKSLWLDMIL